MDHRESSHATFESVPKAVLCIDMDFGPIAETFKAAVSTVVGGAAAANHPYDHHYEYTQGYC
jgi:hypothetical protein